MTNQSTGGGADRRFAGPGEPHLAGQAPSRPGVGRRLDRRQFLLGAAAGLGGLAALGAGGRAGASSKLPARARKPGGPPLPAAYEATLASGVSVPVARWLVLENQKPGTGQWIVTGTQVPHAMEGFASQVSATAGEDVTLFVNTTAKTVTMQAFRMGYYQGLGGRLVYQSDTVAATPQPPPTMTGSTNTVVCPWTPTLSFTVRKDWPPGCYLLKLSGEGGQQQYVPLTVRDDTSNAPFVLQNSVTTWQAYNLWGDYSLYYGLNSSGGEDFADRSRIVSFDRPYPQTWAQGAADFVGNEFPLLYHMESLGIDMTYWTDVDLHARPELLTQHQCLLSLGHDEYWSLEMRNGALQALTQGTNFAFLGANACYRQIRLQPSSVGPNRLQVCYKDPTEDPLYGVNNAVVTAADWASAPTSWPESQLIGSMYQSVGSNDNLVVTDGGSWLFEGCGLTDGQQLPKVVQGEYDRYVPSLPGATNLDVFAHSPVAGQGNWSDITYYTAPGGGGVLASGDAAFVNKLSNTTAFPTIIVPAAIPGVTDVLLRAMENMYSVLGKGPASWVQPSTGNWSAIYSGSAAQAPSAQATPTA